MNREKTVPKAVQRWPARPSCCRRRRRHARLRAGPRARCAAGRSQLHSEVPPSRCRARRGSPDRRDHDGRDRERRSSSASRCSRSPQDEALRLREPPRQADVAGHDRGHAATAPPWCCGATTSRPAQAPSRTPTCCPLTGRWRTRWRPGRCPSVTFPRSAPARRPRRVEEPAGTRRRGSRSTRTQRGGYWRKHHLLVRQNTQRAAMLWYHDHTIGITRLNVYSGLAGTYLLRDARTASSAAHPCAARRHLRKQSQSSSRTGSSPTTYTSGCRPGRTPANDITASPIGGLHLRQRPAVAVPRGRARASTASGSSTARTGASTALSSTTRTASFLFAGHGARAHAQGGGAQAGQHRAGRARPRRDRLHRASPRRRSPSTTPDPAGSWSASCNAANQSTCRRQPDSDTPFGFGGRRQRELDGPPARASRSAKRKQPPADARRGRAPTPAVSPRRKTDRHDVPRGPREPGPAGPRANTEILGSTASTAPRSGTKKPTEVVKTGDTDHWESDNLSLVAHPVHLDLVDFQVIGRQPIDFLASRDIEPISHSLTQTASGEQVGGCAAARHRSGSSGRRTDEKGPKDTVLGAPQPGHARSRQVRQGRPVHLALPHLHHEDHAMMLADRGGQRRPGRSGAAGGCHRRFELDHTSVDL